MATTYDPITGLPRGTGGGFRRPLPFADYGSGGLNLGNGSAVKSAIASTPTPPSTIDFGGFTPDYRSLIDTDPAYLQLKDALSASGIASGAQRDAAWQRAIAQFGIVPDLNSAANSLGLPVDELGGVLTPEVAALAKQNTAAGLSTQARLDQAHSDAVRNIKNALAGRGLIRSGEAGYQLDRENQAYSQSEYDSTQKLLDYLAGVQAAYAQNKQQLAAQLGQGASEAATRQAGMPQNQPSGSTTATYGGVGPDGKPYWVAPDGTKHNQDGSIYRPAAPDANSTSTGSLVPHPDLIPGSLGSLPGMRGGTNYAF